MFSSLVQVTQFIVPNQLSTNLTPLDNPGKYCWYKPVAIGHNKLAEVVPKLMKESNIQGYFTNHSLRASAMTRMYSMMQGYHYEQDRASLSRWCQGTQTNYKNCYWKF